MLKKNIIYTFTMADGSTKEFKVGLDADTFDLVQKRPASLPAWTALDFHQCPHCPLTVATHPHCPLAASIIDIVRHFDEVLSYDQVHLDVVTEERRISQDMTAQKALSSLFGLVIAASGCPHTAFFKPMARFHLPLASRDETLYRATSMYLMAQYMCKKKGNNADFELKGLKTIYDNLHKLNAAVAQRLKAVIKTDVTVNAIIILDVYTNSLPRAIEKSLKELQNMFSAFYRS